MVGGAILEQLSWSRKVHFIRDYCLLLSLISLAKAA